MKALQRSQELGKTGAHRGGRSSLCFLNYGAGDQALERRCWPLGPMIVSSAESANEATLGGNGT